MELRTTKGVGGTFVVSGRFSDSSGVCGVVRMVELVNIWIVRIG